MSKQNFRLNSKQQLAFDVMLEGKNVFLTGTAGTGKTHVIKTFISRYGKHKKIGITSTTGISALLFGGTTLHSFLGIGLAKDPLDKMIQKIRKHSFMLRRWQQLEILIIDEISMLSPELFDNIECMARTLRKSEAPFGGIQLIVSGDFLQLPCVKCDYFCFEANSWRKCIEISISLSEIIRQTDRDFQNCLNAIRMGKIDEKTQTMLSERIGAELKNEFGIKPTRLYSTNVVVDSINEEELEKLNGEDVMFYEYEMTVKIIQPEKKKNEVNPKKHCCATELLTLCTGAQVMLLVNLDLASGLVNGSRGIVAGFDEVGDPIVRFLNGSQRVISYHSWDIEENREKIGIISQLPLKLAYATTIHKSQGATLDLVEVDLNDIFIDGMAYVALSRVKNLQSLSIIDIDFSKITASKKALAFHETIS